TVHKKSSLSRKIADASKAGKAETRAPRKVKFSANLHTCPSSTSSKKSARIGELQVKKRPKKLKQGQRTRKEGG
ncbi:CG43675, partial [Drosophila busckii]